MTVEAMLKFECSFFDFTSLPLTLLGIIIFVVVGYVVAMEIVKLASFRKLIKPKIRPALSAQIQKVRSGISEAKRIPRYSQ